MTQSKGLPVIGDGRPFSERGTSSATMRGATLTNFVQG
jgi:hypothetical protein